MKKFKVYCRYVTLGIAEVDAETEEEARDMVLEDLGLVEDLGFDDWEVYYVEEDLSES